MSNKNSLNANYASKQMQSFHRYLIKRLIASSYERSAIWARMCCTLTGINTVWDQAAPGPAANKANQTGKQMSLRRRFIFNARADGGAARWASHHL